MQIYNPYLNYMSSQQRLAQMEAQYPQFSGQNMYGNMQAAQMSGSLVGAQMSLANQQLAGIQGKMVSDFETVKATETPLDGSVTYFPLVSGEYIYTKFLDMKTGCSGYSAYKKIVDEQKGDKKDDFDIKAYLDEKFETLRQELKGGVRSNGTRKSNSKTDSAEIDEQRSETGCKENT